MRKTLHLIYENLVSAGEVTTDPAQLAVLVGLDRIRIDLEATSTRRRGIRDLLQSRKTAPPRGLYIWGGVGAGKSMLMDMFFDHTAIDRKRRVHFHAFMQEIHDAIHAARQQGTPDPIVPVAAAVAKSARLLCFDEMQISDITDAMLVGRLFEQLFAAGTTIVTTSNRVPDDLYKHGLNRQLFLPFIDVLKSHLVIHHLKSETDYRQDRLRDQQTYFHPLGSDATNALDNIWDDLTGGANESLTLKVKSREVALTRFHNGVARSSFAELCEKPLGAADYLAIAEIAKVLILSDIPQLSRSRNNEAKRFVTLIDALYEARVRLICSAATVPDQLYQDGTGAFEFERTASRLAEMQSSNWVISS